MNEANVKFTIDGKPSEMAMNELFNITMGGLLQGVMKCMDAVALFAVGKYMIAARGIRAAATTNVHPSKLIIRTGRLSGSITKNYRYTISALPRAEYSSFMKPSVLEELGGIQEGYRIIKGTGGKIQAKMGTNVEYGAKHEYGQGVPKRPYLQPGLDDAYGKFSGLIEEQIGILYKMTGWG
uniref:Tail protein n=1 Tax=viral metagenome TaxID=1070528 RepID=A0A6M3L8E8_9ZZZZ